MAKDQTTFLEGLHRQAVDLSEESGLPIAQTPLMRADPGSPELLRQVRMPLDQVVNFTADQNNADPASLSAMGIYLYPYFRGEDKGYVNGTPEIWHGQIYYPVIGIQIRRGLGRVLSFPNHSLRHELGHLFQPDSPSFYERNQSRTVMRALGAVGLAASAAVCYASRKGYVDLSDAQKYTFAALFGISFGPLISPGAAAWLCAKEEWGAEAFACRTRSFRPLSVDTSAR